MSMDYENLPSLPRIMCESILQQVFTHRSLNGRPGHQFEDLPNDPSPDYESLEHLGDSVLGFIATNLIRSMYPNIHVGPATNIRSRVVGNPMLSALSVHYKLPDSLRAHPAQIVALRTSPKIQADLFEAYLAGVYLTQGLETATAWLRALFQPLIEKLHNSLRADYYGYNSMTPSPSPLPDTDSICMTDDCSSSSDSQPTTPAPVPKLTPSGYLMLFNEYLAKHKLFVKWIWDEDTSGNNNGPWRVRIMFNDECVGIGGASTKQAAKNEAAIQALKSFGAVNV